MSKSRPTAPPLPVIAAMVIAALVPVVWISRGSLYEVSQRIAFFLGASGMMVMFYRWRTRGDVLAKILCLTAFGTWALAVLVGSVGNGFTRSHPSFWIAALALLVGLTGGLLTLLRMHQDRKTPDDSTPT